LAAVLGSDMASAGASADATGAPEVVLVDAEESALADVEESAQAALVAGTGAGIDNPQSCCLEIIKQLRVPP
jgi:hypothetical protein